LPRLASVVPFKLDSKGYLIFSIQIGESGLYEFLLDTGSAATIIDRKVAKQLALVQVGEMIIATASQAEKLPLVRLEKVQLGSSPMAAVSAVVADLYSRRHVHGILGLNILGRDSFLLDNKSKRLVFDESGELASRITSPVLEYQIQSGIIVVSSEVNTVPVEFIVDSGANSTVLFHDEYLSVMTTGGVLLSTNLHGSSLMHRGHLTY
jgi:predicted aspartyl protease